METSSISINKEVEFRGKGRVVKIESIGGKMHFGILCKAKKNGNPNPKDYYIQITANEISPSSVGE